MNAPYAGYWLLRIRKDWHRKQEKDSSKSPCSPIRSQMAALERVYVRSGMAGI